MFSVDNFEHPVTDTSAAQQAALLFAGEDMVGRGPVPLKLTTENLRERAAISGLLLAHVANAALEPDGSELGWKFRQDLPHDAPTIAAFSGWLDTTFHTELDKLVASDERVAQAANRWEYLSWPQRQPGQLSQPSTRRQTLLFSQVATEAQCWLKVGSVVARYHSKRFLPEHALPFATERLVVMQRSARKDVGKQYVRGAIVEAITALGVMRHPNNRHDTARRYDAVRTHVARATGHMLAANTFDRLYDVEKDPKTGITLAENPKGFGQIERVRAVPFGCPAFYRMPEHDEDGAAVKPALYRMLRAGIGAMHELDLLQEPLQTSLVDISTATQNLNRALAGR